MVPAAACKDHRMSEPLLLGAEFARALAVKDFARISELLDPEVDFRGLTPRRAWEAGNPDAVVSGILRCWFKDADVIERLDRLELDEVADRQRVGYRFIGRNPDGPFVLEQQAYLSERGGRIHWMRVLCSGFRPVPVPDPDAG
jgi:hypothetical protein